MRSRPAFLTLVVLISLVPFAARAQWTANGVVLSLAANSQRSPTIVSDGTGGAIVTWQDYRSGTNYDIYAQRVNASGVMQWTANDVALCIVASDQYNPAIVSDGAGGAIVVWTDSRSESGIYAQRVNASGLPQWIDDGVPISIGAPTHLNPTIVSDGVGGAIVAWEDNRNGSYTDIFAQRVNAAGVPQWTANGVAVCTAANGQSCSTIASDGAEGAIVAWNDNRTMAYTNIFAQRVNASGLRQWTVNGVALSPRAANQFNPAIVSDGAGGAIVAWNDNRSGTGWTIYAQRANDAGATQWTANAVAMSIAVTMYENSPTIVSDGVGGAIVAWSDAGSGVYWDAHAQRVNAAGVTQWTADGVTLTSGNVYSGDLTGPTIASAGAGGAIVTWEDLRNGTVDIYAQRVNPFGLVQWTDDGIALCTAAYTQRDPMIVSDGHWGAIVTWQDSRIAPLGSDVYAQRVFASGSIPTAVTGTTRGPSLIAGEVYPNPFSGTASMEIEVPAPSVVQIEIFDVAGRRIRAMTLSGSVSREIEIDGRSDSGQLLPSGVYFYRVRAAGESITRKMVIAR